MRSAVQEHEEWGERTRNLFLGVAALEMIALYLGARPAARRWHAASAVVGLAGIFVLYEAAEHGGDLVYRYAGGVGTRSGDTTDVRRLLVAGLYTAALEEREAKRPSEAARLIGELGGKMPADTGVRLMVIESMVQDSKNPAGALAALDSFRLGADNRRWAVRVGTLRSDALAAAGRTDAARAVVERLLKNASDNPRLRQQLERRLERLR